MLYYLIIGLVLVVAYQLTPLARKRPYRILRDAHMIYKSPFPLIWFILFSIGRGLLIVFTYPLLILLFTAAYIYKWIDKGLRLMDKSKPGKYDDIIKGYLSLQSLDDIWIDESEEGITSLDHPHTISSDNGLIQYTLHYY